MVALAGIWHGVQANPPKRNAVGWVAGGRARRCRTSWRVSLAITPTLCQQHSAADDDHREQGRHVHRHDSERLSRRRFWPDGGLDDENSSRYRRTPVGTGRHPGRCSRSDRRARAVLHSGRRMRRAARCSVSPHWALSAKITPLLYK